jgi:hypothetical protein
MQELLDTTTPVTSDKPKRVSRPNPVGKWVRELLQKREEKGEGISINEITKKIEGWPDVPRDVDVRKKAVREYLTKNSPMFFADPDPNNDRNDWTWHTTGYKRRKALEQV